MDPRSASPGEIADFKSLHNVPKSNPPSASTLPALNNDLEIDSGNADYEEFLHATLALREKEQDPDFIPDIEEAKVEEEQDEDLWQDDQDQPVVIIDDHFADDFAEVIAAKSAGEPFLPQFLDRTARLDRDYPTVQSFLEDNSTSIDDAELIIRSCCHFMKNFTRDNSYKEYMALDENDQGMHRHWFQWLSRREPEALSGTIMRALPVQAAALLGRTPAVFTVGDLDRLPHLPPTEVYGGYIDHTTKTMRIDGENDHLQGSPQEEYAYAGCSANKVGMRAGRIQCHLYYLRKNYNDVPESTRSYHYEKACADARPKTWNESRDGPWVPRWTCEWDFRAFSLSYPVDRISDIHQMVEAIFHACFNMVGYHHPTRTRSRGNSPAVEKFIHDMRQYVEAALGRPLPDLHHLSTNRSFGLAEPRRVKASSKKAAKMCLVAGCTRKPEYLSDRDDPYSAHVCMLHYGTTKAFLTREPCIDCGLERKNATSSQNWSATRCGSCRQNHFHTRADWLARDPCANCGVQRVDSSGDFNETKGICTNCDSHFKKNGTQRSKGQEVARQVLTAVRTSESEGQLSHCSHCGVTCDGAKNTPTARQISAKDGKIRCYNCHHYIYYNPGKERPMGWWIGARDFTEHHKDEFMQWLASRPRDAKFCRCGRENMKRAIKRKNGGTSSIYKDTCERCKYGNGTENVVLWPSFAEWASTTAAAQGKSVGDLFEEVRHLEIYQHPAKDTTSKLARSKPGPKPKNAAGATSVGKSKPGPKPKNAAPATSMTTPKPGPKPKNPEENTHGQFKPSERPPRAVKRKIAYYEDSFNGEDDSDKENVDPQGSIARKKRI